MRAVKSKKSVYWPAALLSAGVLAAGCGGGGNNASQGIAPTTTAPAAATTVATSATSAPPATSTASTGAQHGLDDGGAHHRSVDPRSVDLSADNRSGAGKHGGRVATRWRAGPVRLRPGFVHSHIGGPVLAARRRAL